MVTTFIFDVDDTLYDQLEPFRRAFQKHFSRFEDEVKIEELYKLSRKYSDEAFESTGYEITNMRKMHIYRISKAFEELGILIIDEEALSFQLDYEKFQNEIKLIEKFPQIFELLLQRGAKIGIITNGANDNQLRKINQLGLEKWISPGICWFRKEPVSPNPVKKSSKQWKEEWVSQKTTYITLGTISIMT